MRFPRTREAAHIALAVRLTLAAAIAFATLALCIGTAEAQQVPTVTVTSTGQGTIEIDHSCGGVSVGLTPPEIVLTRKGDLTGDLTVSIRGPAA